MVPSDPTLTHAASGGGAPRAAATAATPRTRVVLQRQLDPFERLSPAQRRRLLVRVLCELVAYDEEPTVVTLDRLAG